MGVKRTLPGEGWLKLRVINTVRDHRVRAGMTQQDLVFLNWRVSVAHKDTSAEALGWLQRQHLVPKS